MRHPFELEIADLEIVEASQIRELTDEEIKNISGGHDDRVTTLALGEEGGEVTTLALGEEGGEVTTLALGEEGGGFTTRAFFEEGGCSIEPPIATTLALGEEGGDFH